MRIDKFDLSHLVLNLLILGPNFVFNQELALEILVDFLKLALEHLILLHETADLLLTLGGLRLRLLLQLLLLLEVHLSNTIELLLESKILFQLVDFILMVNGFLLLSYELIRLLLKLFI